MQRPVPITAQLPVPIDTLLHRCNADESCISPEFIAQLTKNKDNKALFETLCPHLCVTIAKLNIQISKMPQGHRIEEMIGTITVTEVYTLLPLMQRGLSKLLGVSTWSVMKVFQNIVQMDRWPACNFTSAGHIADVMDKDLATAHLNGDVESIHIAAARLYQHLEKYSGLHICGAAARFRKVDTEIQREFKAQRSKKLEGSYLKRQRSENQEKLNQPTQNDRKRQRSEDEQEINPPTS